MLPMTTTVVPEFDVVAIDNGFQVRLRGEIDFSKIITTDSPFTDRDMRRTRYLVAKMNEVATKQEVKQNQKS